MFAELKVRGHDVFLVQEFIKPMAIRGEFPTSHGQHYVYAMQQRAEDEVLGHVAAVVTDSPLLMNAAYGLHYGYPGARLIIEQARLFEECFPGLHIWLERRFPFRQEGRYQDEHVSERIGEVILGHMREHLPAERVVTEQLPFEELVRVVEAWMPGGLIRETSS